ITRSTLQDWLGETVKNLGVAVILVTHDIDEAIKLSNRIAIMKDGAFIDFITVSKSMDEHQHSLLKEQIRKMLV
ncbi:MAG: hypothetical protein PHS23_05590, partial [Candidatus Cloacimonetes bacterium]|nr:hypothetical protein [Candidatus Cloacimonadota bacterium]